MAEDTKEPEKRGADGRFGAGNKANPGGRPRMSDAERTMLGDAMPKAIKRLIEGLDAMQYVGMDGRAEPHWKERREYAMALLDRRYGKPSQAITGEGGESIAVGLIVLPSETGSD